uniref:Uncharacterized protein n=1 Tax=Octopus bimaculoides TaxID=37653 RepID=A0A0L8GRV8_OCTBM
MLETNYRTFHASSDNLISPDSTSLSLVFVEIHKGDTVVDSGMVWQVIVCAPGICDYHSSWQNCTCFLQELRHISHCLVQPFQEPNALVNNNRAISCP